MTIVDEEGGDGKGERGELGVALLLLLLLLVGAVVEMAVDGGVVVEVEVVDVVDVVLDGDGVAMRSLSLLLVDVSGVEGASAVSKFDAETTAVVEMATSAMAGVIAVEVDKAVGVSGEDDRVEVDRTVEEGEEGDEEEGDAIRTSLASSFGYASVVHSFPANEVGLWGASTAAMDVAPREEDTGSSAGRGSEASAWDMLFLFCFSLLFLCFHSYWYVWVRCGRYEYGGERDGSESDRTERWMMDKEGGWMSMGLMRRDECNGDG